ncbi:RNA polymerase sigma factor [Actinoplanes sp. NPDC049265]|uniref:RNA polymerase sigma factor n=1 Tax=Actinoplanes sp. NPDC049265 TaxID=3363902 RepID=UPI0037184AA9
MRTLPEPDDEALLRRVARGDGGAMGILHERLAPMLLLRLRARCNDEELIRDVLQESFIAAWQAAAQWDGRGAVAGWLWTITARRLVDAYRRRAVRDAAADRNAATTTDETAPSAESVVLDGVLDERLAMAIRGLSPELRAVLRATVLDGLSTREASVLLGVPEGTVKARAFRARSALKQGLT